MPKRNAQKAVEAGLPVGEPTLLQARVLAGYTQKEVAKMVGISYAGYKAIEREYYGCSDSIYEKLVEILGDFKRKEPKR